MTPSYPVHGRAEFIVDGRILVIRKAGPFNLEFELAYAADVEEPIRQMEQGGPYAVIALYEKSVLTTPEAMQYLVDRVQKRLPATPQCVGQAIVAARDVEGQTLMKELTQRYFDARQLDPGTGAYFTTIDEAKVFLAGLLAAAQVPGY